MKVKKIIPSMQESARGAFEKLWRWDSDFEAGENSKTLKITFVGMCFHCCLPFFIHRKKTMKKNKKHKTWEIEYTLS
jgi:hypothetical protein